MTKPEFLAQAPEFKEMITSLNDYFHPTKIYLFGSRSRGDAHKNSDYDLMLLVTDPKMSGLPGMKQAERVLWGKVWIPADIFILTEKEFEEFKDIPGTIAQTVATEGKEINVA